MPSIVGLVKVSANSLTKSFVRRNSMPKVIVGGGGDAAACVTQKSVWIVGVHTIQIVEHRALARQPYGEYRRAIGHGIAIGVPGGPSA